MQAMAEKTQENYKYEVDDGGDEFTYLIVRPENGGLTDLFRYTILADIGSGLKFLESSDESVVGGVATDDRWIIAFSIIARKMIAFFGKPMEWTGYLVDFILNLLSLNHNITGLLYNFVHGKVVLPERGTETFISTIGHLDGRIDLFKGKSLVEDVSDSVSEETIKIELENRALMDLCIMASKLAYENAKVIKSVVVHKWKMHFVDFFDCWNDFQKQMSTQVFILCDKPKDANLILISFRGTEPFDADDWSTDFDYSWYEIPKLGKVHMGFIEALGLGNIIDAATFQNQLLAKNTNFAVLDSDEFNKSPQTGIGSSSSNAGSDMGQGRWNQSFESEGHASAYYVVRQKLKSLLEEHKTAKFIVTGHSLGGALAILFPTVLVLHEEMEIMQRLLGVYTFGQPRIGDRQLGRLMEAHLEYPIQKYFRVVYCNDLVPRLPYDNKTFLYKHFGVCLYYDSRYLEQRMEEEPNKNYFGLRYLIREYLNAIWELIRSLTMGCACGAEYNEGWFSIILRVMGLVLPGLSAHSPRDYVNSVRLGEEYNIQMSPL